MVSYPTPQFLLPIMRIPIHLPAQLSHLFRPREGSPADETIHTDPFLRFDLQPQYFALSGLGMNIFLHFIQDLYPLFLAQDTHFPRAPFAVAYFRHSLQIFDDFSNPDLEDLFTLDFTFVAVAFFFGLQYPHQLRSSKP